MLYQWSVREEPLGHHLFTARSLRVDQIQEVANVGRILYLATGVIEVTDHMEGFTGEDPWQARGSKGNPHVDLVVWDVKPGKEHYSDHFTLVPQFDAAVGVFVSARLEELRQRMARGEKTPILVGREIYAGPRVEYSGDCVCHLVNSPYRKFEWEKYTEGGKFPQNCFKCSCGRKWWNVAVIEEGQRVMKWLPVIDNKAWELLLDGNGELESPFAFLRGGIELTETLRGQGFIPLG